MRSALLELRQHPARWAAVVLTVAIGVAFLTACVVFPRTETASIGHRAAARTAGSDVVVDVPPDPAPRVREVITTTPGVRSVEPSHTGYAEVDVASGLQQVELASMPEHPRLLWAGLDSGRWPATSQEVAVTASTASRFGWHLGSVIQLTGGDEQPEPERVRVVGLTDQTRSMLSGLTEQLIIGAPYFSHTSGGTGELRYLVLTSASSSPTQVAAALNRRLPEGATAATSAEVTRQTIAELTDGADVFGYLLLIFSAVALLVGGLLITNTFTILITQRRRRIGLLRALGASTAQVRRQVLLEALLVGGLGAVLGLVLGVGVATGAAAITGSLADGLVVPAMTVAAAGVAGVVVTVSAALLPANRAMRIAPLEALRPLPDEATARTSSRRRLLAAGLLAASGAAVTAVAVGGSSNNLLLAVAGSAVLAVGILLAAPIYLPMLLRLAGRVVAPSGPTARLAGANTLRNPARTAATGVALMLAVGLVVTLQVGAASTKSSVQATLADHFPVDISVSTDGPLPPRVVADVRDVAGLRATSTIKTSTVTLRTSSAQRRFRLAGLPPDAAAVVSTGLGQLRDGVVLVGAATGERLGLHAGDRVRLGFGRRSIAGQVQFSRLADSTRLVVTEKSLLALNPQAPATAIWAAVDARSDAQAVMAGVRQASRQVRADVGGTLEESSAVNALLDTLLTLSTALLAVAVLIALIGVGNTLGLSVVERVRDSALLRALGLQRRQLFLMLTLEAVLIALVGSVVGVAAGVLFGTLGTAALAEEASLDVVRFSISAGQTLAVVAVAILAAAVSSILPGRRAASAHPTRALAAQD